MLRRISIGKVAIEIASERGMVEVIFGSGAMNFVHGASFEGRCRNLVVSLCLEEYRWGQSTLCLLLIPSWNLERTRPLYI
jgi:hypothetical protein